MRSKGIVVRSVLRLCVVGILLSTTSSSQGQTLNWLLPGGGNWHDPNNWDGHRFPTLQDTVRVNQGEAQVIEPGGTAVAGELHLATGDANDGKVRLDPNRMLRLKRQHGLIVGLRGQGEFTQLPGSQVVIDDPQIL